MREEKTKEGEKRVIHIFTKFAKAFEQFHD